MFELHCTLDRTTSEFKRICKFNDIKLISIALLNKNNQQIAVQEMTSIQTMHPANEWKKLSHFAAICGLQILRTKVECSPHSTLSSKYHKYYECHFHAPENLAFPKSLRLDKKDSVGYTFRATTLEEFNTGYV